MFGLGSAFYLILFITNALAVLSEERFLARVGWSSHALAGGANSFDQGFQSNPYAGGPGGENVTIKARLINLISAVRTLMRSKYPSPACPLLTRSDADPKRLACKTTVPLVVINIVVVIYLIVLG